MATTVILGGHQSFKFGIMEIIITHKINKYFSAQINVNSLPFKVYL